MNFLATPIVPSVKVQLCLPAATERKKLQTCCSKSSLPAVQHAGSKAEHFKDMGRWENTKLRWTAQVSQGERMQPSSVSEAARVLRPYRPQAPVSSQPHWSLCTCRICLEPVFSQGPETSQPPRCAMCQRDIWWVCYLVVARGVFRSVCRALGPLQWVLCALLPVGSQVLSSSPPHFPQVLVHRQLVVVPWSFLPNDSKAFLKRWRPFASVLSSCPCLVCWQKSPTFHLCGICPLFLFLPLKWNQVSKR